MDWLGITSSKYYHWKTRYGKINVHNGTVPRDHWLEEWERKVIVDFWIKNPLEGYRLYTYIVIDQNLVAAYPSSVAGSIKHWAKEKRK